MTYVHAVLSGVPIDGYTMDGALDRISELVASGRAADRTHQVATVNVDFLVNALDDPGVMGILQQNDLNLADGMPLVWASRLLGSALPERVAGADLVPMLAQRSAAQGLKVHLFGAGPGVAERARAFMLEHHPNALITADAGPAMIDPANVQDEVVNSISEAAPDVLCVALGNPKQERFIATYRGQLRCPVMIGVGGSLDMLVGDKKRAPRWLQRSGGEWIFRLVQEPGRLGRRYGRDAVTFGPQLVSYARTLRRFGDASHLSAGVEPGRVLLVGPTQTTEGSLLADDLTGIELVNICLHGADALHPDAHTRMLGLIRRARTERVAVRVSGVSPSMRACFAEYGTSSFISNSDES